MGWFPKSWTNNNNNNSYSGGYHDDDDDNDGKNGGFFSTTNNVSSTSSSFVSKLKEYVHLSPETESKLNKIFYNDGRLAILPLPVFDTTQMVVVGVACATSFAFGWKVAKFTSTTASFRRFYTMSDVPPSLIGSNSNNSTDSQIPFLIGRVVSVSDGDTFRMMHQPTITRWIYPSKKLQEGDKLSDNTLQIRICTIDTPETSKFGKPGQPFGEEAKQHLESLILNRTVHIRLLQKDQYGRGVAEVLKRGPFFGYPKRYMDAEMLSKGFAEVYEGSGAVYGHYGKDYYMSLQDQAQRNQRGIWSQTHRESAAQYKARMKK